MKSGCMTTVRKYRLKLRTGKLKMFPNVTYIELPENLGRAAIRNKMGRDSKYKFLLFIDADSKLVTENYLSLLPAIC